VSYAPEDNLYTRSCHCENFKCHVLLHKCKLKGMVTEIFCDAISLLRCVSCWMHWGDGSWMIVNNVIRSPPHLTLLLHLCSSQLETSLWYSKFFDHHLSKIYLDLLLSTLCSSEKDFLWGSCMAAREIRLLLAQFIWFPPHHATYHYFCFVIYLCWRHKIWVINWLCGAFSLHILK